MSPHADILLDFNHMIREGVGDKAPTVDDINALRQDCDDIHRGLVDLRRLGQLPFWDLPTHDDAVEAVVAKANELRENYETMLLLGIGGSALGADFLVKSLKTTEKPRVIVVDDLDGREWSRLAETLDW